MSIRITLCFLFVLFFAIYAWRNWFVSLCASVLLMAVVQHPDMPRNIGGVQGLNPWNFLFLNIFLAWWRQRRLAGHVWEMPGHVMLFLGLYMTIVLISPLRLLIGDHARWGFKPAYIISEHIVNCLKWVFPGLLLFDACRSRQRAQIALGVILLLYFLLAVQVIRWVPLSTAVGGNISYAAARMIQNEIGYNRVTLSMMLGGASWAILCCLVLAQKRSHKRMVLGMAAVVTLGQALTGGRTGYVSWFVVGVVLSLLRWRRFLLVIPVVLGCVVLFLPGVTNRFFQGFGGKEGNIVVQRDEYEMTSGRTLAWPLVIEEIYKSPVFGYGRQGMTTTGIQAHLAETEDEAFPHPHNAYLEVLLDNGVVGFLGVIPFYLIILWHGFRLLLDRHNAICTAAGGAACALVLALLVGAMGGQTFYPREGSVGMWAAIGIMLRISLECSRSRLTGEPLFGEEESEARIEIETSEESPQPA